MTNSDIAKLFRHVAASYAIKNEAKYRFQILAYQKAADSIEHSTTAVKDLAREGKLDKLSGVGSSMQKHLDELFKTGKVAHFESVMEDVSPAVFPLLDVPTFGAKKAYKLVSAFKLTNPKTVIQDIKKLAEEGKIASLEGFGEKSQADILRAFSEHKEGKGKSTRMALPFAFDVAQKLVTYLKTSKYIADAQPLGSLRRMVSTIGDIDVGVATDNPKEAIKHFLAYPYKDRVIEEGPVSASILLTNGKQIDLIALQKNMFGSLLQHFTGSKNHNVHLREYALKKGLSLSERGIKKVGKEDITTYDTEEKFYKALGMPWIAPELREDTGEIEAALKGNLPTLVELKDIKGDLHVHSSYPIEPSHDMGKDSFETMLKKAKTLGYEYVGFSEHNPSVSKHTPESIYSILSRRNESIEHINSSTKYPRIISLLETDILTNGKLAINDNALSLLDGTLVSIHSSFNMDTKEMTKRVLEGLSHPKAKILTHPTGRLLNIRPGYTLDFEKIFDFALKHNKAIEINAWPTRP
jgi:DNA polymerase (family 10)